MAAPFGMVKIMLPLLISFGINFTTLSYRSDAVTFDCNSIRKEWPYFGGVNGSIRFDCELELPANLGLKKAITDLLTPIKRKYRSISWADLMYV